MSLSNKKSVAIYYDGDYISKVAKYYATNNIVSYRLNISVLHNYIIDSVKSVVKEEANSGIYISSCKNIRSRRLTDDITHKRNLLYWERINHDNLTKAGITPRFVQSCGEVFQDEATVCTTLSLELYEKAITTPLDVVVIIAGGVAYLPLIDKLKSRGVDVIVVGWEILRTDDLEHEANCNEQLLANADHSLVINTILDDNPEGLKGFLTEMGAPKHIVDDSDEVIGTISNSDEIGLSIGEWSVSEIINLKHNFGFIKNDTQNIFFHEVDYSGDFSQLEIGDNVEFVLDKSADGQILARNVSKVESNLHLFEEGDYSVGEEFFDWDS